MNPDSTAIPSNDKKYLWFLFLIIFPLYLTWTFDHSLWNPDETRDAGIAREMFVRKDFITPHLNGEAFLEKPPLYYWTCSAVYALTGRITAGLTRFPAALYGFLGIFFTFLIGKRLYDAETGFMAAGVLATSFQYFNMSHYALMDSSLAALLTGAFYFYLAGSPLGFILMAILAFYTKGFVAFALAGVVIGTDLVIKKEFGKLIKITLAGVVLFALLATPWVYKLWKAGGQNYLRVFFIDNNWNRFFSHTITDHRQPIYYYLGSFPLDFLPWTFLLIAGLVQMFKKKNVPGHRFTITWFLAIFVFLSLSSSKRSMYLLPAFPAAALFLAGWLRSQTNGRKIFQGFFIGTCVIILAGDIFFVGKLDRDKTFLPVIDAIKQQRADAVVAGFDLSEMERGVFPFYLEENIRNIKTTDELAAAIDAPGKLLLLTNRNKIKDIGPVLNGKMEPVFAYRPGEKTRSYMIYQKR